jgi:hypothetical protein
LITASPVDGKMLAFTEFLECFDKDIIVTLKVYLDESVDIAGRATGKIVPVICGFMASTEDWKRFVFCWKSALEKHHAKSFHFREYSTKQEYEKIGNQYYGWSKNKRDRFLYDLATEAGLFTIPIGILTDAEDDRRKGLDPYEEIIKRLFKEISKIAKTVWPFHHDKISIIWDNGAGPEWSVPMIKIHSEYVDLPDSNIGGLLHGDDKTILPLQAADLYSYAVRQMGERYLVNSDKQKVRLLDFLLNKNTYDHAARHCNEDEWRALVAELMALKNIHTRKSSEKFYVTKELIDSYDFKIRKFA